MSIVSMKFVKKGEKHCVPIDSGQGAADGYARTYVPEDGVIVSFSFDSYYLKNSELKEHGFRIVKSRKRK